VSAICCACLGGVLKMAQGLSQVLCNYMCSVTVVVVSGCLRCVERELRDGIFTLDGLGPVVISIGSACTHTPVMFL
jgi:hypothetical protein